LATGIPLKTSFFLSTEISTTLVIIAVSGYLPAMFWIAIAIIVLLIALAVFLHVGQTMFDGWSNKFLYLVAAILVLVLGAGVFLTHAVPSLANGEFKGTQNASETKKATIVQDNPVGLKFQEE
jgi:hypothetical protein